MNRSRHNSHKSRTFFISDWYYFFHCHILLNHLCTRLVGSIDSNINPFADINNNVFFRTVYLKVQRLFVGWLRMIFY